MISGPSGETNDGRKTDKVGGYDTTQLWRPRLSQAVDRRGKAVQAVGTARVVVQRRPKHFLGSKNRKKLERPAQMGVAPRWLMLAQESRCRRGSVIIHFITHFDIF